MRQRSLSFLTGLAAVAGASLMFSASASAEVVYSFLDAPTASFTLTSDPITSMSTIASSFCSDAALCKSVTFTPNANYDEVSLLDGEDFYFTSTAFNTVGAYFEQAEPVSSNPTAEFSTLIASATPEPATWALMIAGVGTIGLALRQAKRRGFKFATAV